jgi:hypothetical protein
MKEPTVSECAQLAGAVSAALGGLGMLVLALVLRRLNEKGMLG